MGMEQRDKVMDQRDIEDGILALVKGDRGLALVMFERGMEDNGMRHRVIKAIRDAA